MLNGVRSAPALPLTALILTYLAAGAPSPLFLDAQAALGFDDRMLGLVYGGFPLGLATALITTGSLADRIGRRPVIVGSLVTLAAAMTLYATSGDVWGLVIARIIQGIATGTVTGAAAASAVELAERRASRATGQLVSAAPLLGLGLGALAAAAAADGLDAGVPLVFAGFASAFALLATLSMALRETRPARAPVPSIHQQTRRAFPLRDLAPLLPAQLTVWLPMGFLLAYNGTILAAGWGVEGALINGATLCTMLTVAALAARLGSLPAWAMVGIGAVLAAVAAMLMATGFASSDLPLYVIAVASAGLGYGAVFSGATRLAVWGAPGALSARLSGLYLMGAMSNALPVLAAGAATTRAGVPAVVLTVMLVAACTAVLTAIQSALMTRRALAA